MAPCFLKWVVTIVFSPDCGDPTPANGQAALESGKTTLGSNATVSCNTGYDVNGVEQITCMAAGWSSLPSCQIQG